MDLAPTHFVSVKILSLLGLCMINSEFASLAHRMRGLQWTWGPAIVANVQTTASLFRKLFLLNLPLTLTIALIVLFRDSPLGTPASGLMWLGVPNFPGLKFLSESIYTAAFGTNLALVMEIRLTSMTIAMTFIHKLATWIDLPDSILDLCDPVYLPPVFKSPHKAQSLAEFWGHAWHVLLQRIFLIGGGKPMVWIAKTFGASSRTQRVAGLFGTFAISAFLHEYGMYTFYQANLSQKQRCPIVFDKRFTERLSSPSCASNENSGICPCSTIKSQTTIIRFNPSPRFHNIFHATTNRNAHRTLHYTQNT